MSVPSPSTETATKAPLSFFGRVRSAFSLARTIVLGILAIIALLAFGVYAFINILPAWLPIIIPVVFFAPIIYFTYQKFLKERAPYPVARFSVALMIGMAIEPIIYVFMAAMHLYSPGRQVVCYGLSVAAGYVAWRATLNQRGEANDSVPKLAGWLVGLFAGLCVAAILGSLIPVIGDAEHLVTSSWITSMSESDDR